MDAPSQLRPLWEEIKEYLSLNVENIRLLVAEKIVRLLSTAALAVTVLVLAVFVLIFFAVALADFLSLYVASYWAYIIVGGVFTVIAAVIFFMRKVLIIDPVSRFISRIFFS